MSASIDERQRNLLSRHDWLGHLVLFFHPFVEVNDRYTCECDESREEDDAAYLLRFISSFKILVFFW